MSVGDSLVLALADDMKYLINVQYPMLDKTHQDGFLSSGIVKYFRLRVFYTVKKIKT